MTKKMRCLLTSSLMSLAPSIALAEQTAILDADFLSPRHEYVSVKDGAIQLPVRKEPSEAFVDPATQDFFVYNLTGATLALHIQSLTGAFIGVRTPYPVPPLSYGGFQISAPAPAPVVVQQYAWTVDPANPAGSKTCVWRVEVSAVGGSCTAQVFFGTYGGAVCTVDSTLSFVDPTTCQTQLVTNMQ
ncbi:hypothetical protein HPC49_19050 [Pyxidicoccus fallax]|uniref:Uncharacterized protein n=1 Tax=Pyxidicoccus fallax TaxID=394095 RepID=A0A848L553_9BACT|nr:hypothetical protein [Pyxidicoccus fallax]NMO13402.1 hypothetical protein [Pyxidicoccus fallax]NPC80311.1 hypothetical protein [Pyxidicoccus fallax]